MSRATLRRWLSLSVAAVLLLPAGVTRAEPQIIITTRPTTAPAALGEEQLAIKQVILDFATAMAQKDLAKAQAYYAGDDVYARTVIVAMIDAVHVNDDIVAAVREQFGDAGVEEIPVSGPERFARACEKIQNVQVDGDKAVVDRRHILDPFRLENRGGAWRIVGLPKAFADPDRAVNIAEELEVYRRIAAETREGKFADATAVKRAMQERTFALKQAREAAKQPATTPTTQGTTPTEAPPAAAVGETR